MFTTFIIECISWLIKVTDNNYARWKPEIKSLLSGKSISLKYVQYKIIN